ncbi:cysteinyl-tRNA synthetase [Salsuginibacillus halophilus]|uniref:Cysteine--tRNA ligase n=1 Tax=Salsuginibacillus halophilus TaxID=517424 RepID=A0A2P8H519_9BACI|nr:cysteine--tRNA ligase [Salsuginibacillus halophilus]PSL41303.1 cysteinyl-tRNA synthetase [Salsuginibacillus halophilus]
MTIQMYNTLRRQKEAFAPMEEGKVSMYVCGPTVYNYIHIGNARPAIVFDMVRRYFMYRGYEVTYVSNFTDVDDKIIKAAEETGEDVLTLAETFIRAYHEDTKPLGVLPADKHPRVTEAMDDIIVFIERLIEKGYAYEVAGDVYFSTRSFTSYGKLSGQDLEDLQAGARIDVDEAKKDPLDFALWKQAKPGEIAWQSPWGEGRPGWHIECSAMVQKHLGETIDIHAGGQDLAFPHHENEIAQSEALTGEPLAHYWLHNGYITVDDEKMSKSLGNFILVHNIIQQHDANVIRYYMLQSHYRNPINFNDELIESAQNSLNRIQTLVDNIKHRLQESADLGSEGNWLEELDQYRYAFVREMDDDFNTPNAFTVIFDFVKAANRYLDEAHSNVQVLEGMLELLREWEEVLGLTFERAEEVLDEEVEALIEQRIQARKDRNFQEADRIRDDLAARGIILEDTAQGTRWKRG